MSTVPVPRDTNPPPAPRPRLTVLAGGKTDPPAPTQPPAAGARPRPTASVHLGAVVISAVAA